MPGPHHRSDGPPLLGTPPWLTLAALAMANLLKSTSGARHQEETNFDPHATLDFPENSHPKFDLI